MVTFYHEYSIKSNLFDRRADLLVLHECLPDELAARVLGHEQSDSHVDADHVGISPSRLRIKCIDKTVPLPNALSEALAHGAQGANAFTQQKRNRAARCRRHKRAVERALFGRAAPGHVAL